MIRLLVAAAVLVPSIAAAESALSPYLYLNRCRGGCTVNAGGDDARTMTSSIPCSGTVTCGNGGCSCTGGTTTTFFIEEFKDSQGNTGDAANAEWDQIVQCVREVYSPFNIIVTDQLPPNGMSHNQGIVAGRPSNIGYGGAGVGGIAPGGCDAKNNVISFTFSNIFSGADRVTTLCFVAAQETAHAYGLDHEYEFIDHRSACTDPMSYRGDCGGQRFFRNELAACGEFSTRPCRCGAYQNSHVQIAALFGTKPPITRPPAVRIDAPLAGATIGNGAIVTATASAQRGIDHVDLYLNDYKWTTVKGVAFGPTGQPEAPYALAIPAGVPDSIIDIVVKAYDDLDIETVTAPITVTKGAPCTSASTCAKGQLCEEGKCFWPPPAGEIGDTCDYPQFCKNGLCVDTTEGMFCSQQCVVGVADSCPMGFVCDGPSGGNGYCVSADSGAGCCGVGSDARASLLLALGVLGLISRRSRASSRSRRR